MSNERKIYKPKPVSGFPEWLPEARLIEQQWFDHIRRVFESYGFCNIETPSVEELDVLSAKGEVDKEIYVIERLHKDDDDKGEARLALHFDQTVPLARYVAMHFNDLVFPFKRYQMQRVWRGERPQAGRFREFYQCDIDVIGVDHLPLHFDAEMPAVMWEVMNGLPGMEGEKFQIQISNRKILIGLVESLVVANQDQIAEIFRLIDKKEKLSVEQYKGDLEETISGLQGNNKENLARLYSMIMALPDLTEFLKSLPNKEQQIEYLKNNYGVEFNEIFRQGIDELVFVLENLAHLPQDAVVPDLTIVRGLDYYTGTVYETRFLDDPGYGSICSGGRYDDLAGSYISKHLPGVGISIGFSRLFARMHEKGKLPLGRKSPADLMVVMPSEEQRAQVAALCQSLRKHGLKVEMYHAAKKIPDQLKYASRKGIPYVWFPETEGRTHEVKNMTTGDQSPADPQHWKPEGKALEQAA